MLYRFFLDSTLIDEPIGSFDLVDSIRRDRNLKGILRTQDASLSFIGSGYRYLYDVWRDAYDSDVDCIVERSKDEGQNWMPYYKGKVFVSEIEWNEREETAKVKVQDNSFYARINNNKSIKISPKGGKSKNGVTIASPTIYQWESIYKDDGTDVWKDDTNAIAEPYFYFVHDLLEYMIKWMSDDEMTFRSDELTNGWEGIVLGASTQTQFMTLTTGRALRKCLNNANNVNTDDFIEFWPGLDFQTLLKNVLKTADFSFIIDYTTAKPEFRLERESFFRSNSTLATFENIDEVITKTDLAHRYSKISFGSSQVTNGDTGWAQFPERVPLMGWNQEEYAIIDNSPIDATLDLRLDFITSTNMIEDVYQNLEPSGDDSNDKEFFLIMTYDAGGPIYRPAFNDWFSDPPSFCYKNELLNNEAIINRHLGGITQGMANVISQAVDSTFRASLTASIVGDQFVDRPTISPVIFDDDSTLPNFDTTNNYNTGNGQFIAPSYGPYSFSTYIRFFVFNPGVPCGSDSFTISTYIDRYDSGLSLISSQQICYYSSLGRPPGTLFSYMSGSRSVVLNAGDIVRVRIEAVEGNNACNMQYGILATSFFKCISYPLGGGTSVIVDPNEYPAFRHEFKFPITPDQWEDILLNPKGLIAFAMDGQQIRYGRIEDIKYSNKKSSRVVLNSTKNLNP